jgi:hypothetical protein
MVFADAGAMAATTAATMTTATTTTMLSLRQTPMRAAIACTLKALSTCSCGLRWWGFGPWGRAPKRRARLRQRPR